jgi:hypothetical protein
MTKFTFTTKEEYIAYRANWKAEYSKLSQQIRDRKFCRWYGSLQLPERKSEAMQKRYDALVKKEGFSCAYVTPLKNKATEMLEELKAAKVEAQRQYLATKAGKAELVAA